MTHPKFIQIAVTHDPASGDSVYGLDSSGEVYIFVGDAWETLDDFAKSAEDEDGG